MRMVQVRADCVVDVVAMGHALVSALRAVHMATWMLGATMRGRASGRIRRSTGNLMLVDMIAVDIVQVPVVQIIGVSFMLDGGVPTAATVHVRMLRMSLACHGCSPCR
jgi:hypothetical protein